MANREQPDDLIHRIKFELLNAGLDIQKLHIDLHPSVVIVVRPVQFLVGEIWIRLMAFLRRFGFRWFREEGAWKRGSIQ